MNEYSGAKRAVRSKQMSEWTREWPSIYFLIWLFQTTVRRSGNVILWFWNGIHTFICVRLLSGIAYPNSSHYLVFTVIFSKYLPSRSFFLPSGSHFPPLSLFLAPPTLPPSLSHLRSHPLPLNRVTRSTLGLARTPRK